MNRRDFLSRTARTTLGLAALPLAASAIGPALADADPLPVNGVACFSGPKVPSLTVTVTPFSGKPIVYTLAWDEARGQWRSSNAYCPVTVTGCIT